MSSLVLLQLTADADADPLPRVTDAALLTDGITLVDSGSTAIVISETDFKKALASSKFYQVEPRLRNEAMDLAARANEVNTIGLVGSYKIGDTAQLFSGHIFIVAQDPMASGDGKLVQTTRYYVAVVELAGKAEWIGTTPQFAIDNRIATGRSGRCCGTPVLAVVNPRPIPDPNIIPTTPPCEPPQYCGDPQRGVTTTVPPQLEARIANGLMPIGLQLYPTMNTTMDLPLSGGELSKFAPQTFASVHTVVDPTCTMVTPQCEEGQEGYTRDKSGFADVPSGSTTCQVPASSRTVYFQDLPPICRIISSPAQDRVGGGRPVVPITCGGMCVLNCKEPGSSFAHGFPPGCAMMDPVEGSSICKTPSEQEKEATLKNLQAIAKYTGGAGVSRTCEPATRQGTICTECDKNGCRQIPILYPLGGTPDIAAGDEPDKTEKSRDEELDDKKRECKGVKTCEDEVEKCRNDKTCNPEQKSERDKKIDEEKGKCGSNKSCRDDVEKCRNTPDCTPKVTDPAHWETLHVTVIVPKSNPPPSSPPQIAVVPPGPPVPIPKKVYKPENGPFSHDHGKPQDPDPQKAAQPKPSKNGDPVVLGTGALSHIETDLSFDGPVRPLEFRRLYDSQSGDRSTLGSNWRHNWDQTIVPLNAETTPAWALPYCAGSETTTMCVVFHDHQGGQTLFFLDMGSGLFMPQAGNTDTIAKDKDGAWSLRRKDGHELYFNKEGYLTLDVDRFGNGFKVEYESTPLHRLFQHFCSPDALEGRTLHHRQCAVLAYFMGEIARPGKKHEGWTLSADDFPLPSSSAQKDLMYARAYFLHVLTLGQGSQSVYGTRRLRPITVTDDLGRRLRFHYAKGTPVPVSLKGQEYEFAKRPDAELLESISGPAGTLLKFAYDRPQTHPLRLNEMFLTKVERKDAPQTIDLLPAPDRKAEYRYQWPNNLVLPYASDAKIVRTRYQSYYETFIGCWLKRQNCPGEYFVAEKASGDPEDLALHQAEGYLSEVADNILEIINNGVTTLESRYAIDPLSSSFDKVLDQRYGSSLAQQDTSLIQKDLPSDQWRTALPKASYQYYTSGPVAGGGDLTDLILHPTLRERYPLEESSLRVEQPVVSCEPAVGAPPGRGEKSCDYKKMKELLRELPGYEETLPYFSPIEKEIHPNLRGRLYRSRLTCAQLALAQLSDPTHNDLLSDLTPILATTDQTDHVAERISGQRKAVAADANRICAWTEFRDRDGDFHYYGLNFQGQALVHAIWEKTRKDFIFLENLYNADGMVVQTRRPTRGKKSWSVAAGYTAFSYEELDPKGNNGWNDWIPVYWSRRTNLVRIEMIAAGGGVTDDAEQVGGSPTKSLGRYFKIKYEPLFSQVQWVESGALEEPQIGGVGQIAPIEIPNSQTTTVFDYQELNWDDPAAIKPLLDRFRQWGFGWMVDKDDYDYKNILGWQLPVKFYSSDINGDGQQGFPYRRIANGRAVGLPILVQEQPRGLLSDYETTILSYAPHGQPASIETQAGERRLFSYYALGKLGFSPYGGTQVPLGNEVSPGFAGFLAKVDVRRISGTPYDTSEGPNSKPCPHLLGPYQWVLSETCPQDVRAELTKLGLEPAFVETIAASSEPESADRWVSTALGYSEIGKPRFGWTHRGTTQITRDVDGRVRKRIDEAGNRMEVLYSVEGNPIVMGTFDSQGKVTKATFQHFDEEGHLIYRCEALSVGGCDRVVNLGRPPRLSDPVKDGVVNQFFYAAEGALKASVDPEGLRTQFERNEQKLPIRRWKEHPSVGVTTARSTYFDYTSDGDLEAVHYGARPTSGAGGPQLSERYEYDGLQRVSRLINVRGFSLHWAYSNRDQVARMKQDGHPYYVVGTTSPVWERTFRRDAYGRVIEERDNGVVTGQYRRGKGGRIFSWSAAGLSETFVTYDDLGKILWSIDSDGNQRFTGQRLTPEKSFSAQVRRNKAGQQLTTGLTTEFNVLGLPTSYIELGNGFERTWSVIREASGDVKATNGPDGARTEYQRNLLGWPTKISQLTDLGTSQAFDHTIPLFNKRGQMESFTDPSQQVIQWTHNGFGEIIGVSIPGQPMIEKSYTYDRLGRPETEVRGKYELRYQYDERGDMIEVSYRVNGTDPFRVLTKQRFDELGRNVESVYDNVLLTHLPPSERLVTRRTNYDPAGRVELESISMGAQENETKSDWKLISNKWVRRIDEGALEEAYDQLGRMESLVRKSAGSGQSKISFDWLGDLYVGRTHEQIGRPSPFRETRELGPFGELAKLSYTAIDVSASGHPKDQKEGDAYCGGLWNATYCALPVLSIEAQRDVVGRIVSLSSQFGFPILNSGTLVPNDHPRTWRGYAYNAMGQVSNVWEHEGMPTPVVTTSLKITGISPTELAQIANLSGANPVLYKREVHVGGTSKIGEPGGTRWELLEPRGPGHQLQKVFLDKQTLKIQHDLMGQIEVDGKRVLEFDPLGRLARVKDKSSQVEQYAYDDAGRLVAVYSANAKKPDETFRYDGLQMVTSFDVSHQPRWETTWGPGIDQLLAWDDRAGKTGEHVALTDHRNDVVATWQSKISGIAYTADYNPEGRVELKDNTRATVCDERGKSGTCLLSGVPFGFTSAWRSKFTGLMFLRNRWYSPELGQFISHDPYLGFESFNLYSYAAFDAINLWDPFGLKPNGFSPRQGQTPVPMRPSGNPQNILLPDRATGLQQPVVKPPLKDSATGFQSADPNYRPVGSRVRRPGKGLGQGVIYGKALDSWLEGFNGLVAEYEESQARWKGILEWIFPGPGGLPVEDPCEAPCSLTPVGDPATAQSMSVPGLSGAPMVFPETMSSGSMYLGPRDRFMEKSRKTIVSTPGHPLKFLINPGTNKWWSRNKYSPNPNVQAGHLISKHILPFLQAPERLAIEDATWNQNDSNIVETYGGYVEKGAVEIAGVVVELRTAETWVKAGLLKQEILSGAASSPGWMP